MTYALMEISEAAFNEIAEKLMKAGYEHAVILRDDHVIHLNMHGIGLGREERKLPQTVTIDGKELKSGDLVNIGFVDQGKPGGDYTGYAMNTPNGIITTILPAGTVITEEKCAEFARTGKWPDEAEKIRKGFE